MPKHSLIFRHGQTVKDTGVADDHKQSGREGPGPAIRLTRCHLEERPVLERPQREAVRREIILAELRLRMDCERHRGVGPDNLLFQRGYGILMGVHRRELVAGRALAYRGAEALQPVSQRRRPQLQRRLN